MLAWIDLQSGMPGLRNLMPLRSWHQVLPMTETWLLPTGLEALTSPILMGSVMAHSKKSPTGLVNGKGGVIQRVVEILIVQDLAKVKVARDLH